ncbi:hypothetical protein GCM10016234_09880 [Tianweitania populi]|uniref:Uncharacterized protein n=1 Tax=Tianweitania populi TaxID=1607949 RepID=A0A8J3GJS4_9HYPH|nr:hypothetical protein GCM10016234_09880 [Tianweitania populi]
MPGPFSLRLHESFQQTFLRIDRGANLICTTSHNDGNVASPCTARGGNDVANKGEACHFMQNLWQSALHAGALAGRKDDGQTATIRHASAPQQGDEARLAQLS